jgi:hypothetical protein
MYKTYTDEIYHFMSPHLSSNQIYSLNIRFHVSKWRTGFKKCALYVIKHQEFQVLLVYFYMHILMCDHKPHC